MAAIDNLEGASQLMTAAVDKASAKIDVLIAGQGSGVDEARVQAVADVVAADAARLDAKAGDPVPEPTPEALAARRNRR